jgi:hypothetical protein
MARVDDKKYTKIMEELPNNTVNLDKPYRSTDEKGML